MAIPFEQYATQWLKDREVNGRPLAARTVEGYESLLMAHINLMFGKMSVHAITRQVVNEWCTTLPKDKPTTRARTYSLLRAILATAVVEEHLTANPANIRGAGSSMRKHRVTLPTDDQFEALTEAMPDHYKAMLLLAYWCGLRFGELTELRRADVDTKDGIARVRRAVVLVRGEFVVKDTKSAAGERDVLIPKFVLPHLRHAHLTKFTQMGATTAEVMKQAGHSTTAASQRYQHAAEDRMRELNTRMEAGYNARSAE